MQHVQVLLGARMQQGHGSARGDATNDRERRFGVGDPGKRKRRFRKQRPEHSMAKQLSHPVKKSWMSPLFHEATT